VIFEAKTEKIQTNEDQDYKYIKLIYFGLLMNLIILASYCSQKKLNLEKIMME